MSEWMGPIIELERWDQFAQALKDKVEQLNSTREFAVRNFDLITFKLGPNYEMGYEINRLEIVRRTGTDRDSESLFWNAEGHDHDHETCPMGKDAAEIIYAYVVEITDNGYLVRYNNSLIEMDITYSLTAANGILVYDASKLKRVSKNEFWFLTNPKDALVTVFIVKA